MTSKNGRNLFLVLGNQLFNPDELLEKGCTDVYMSEDFGLCTYQKHHKLKLYLFLTAMREYKDTLMAEGINVHYNKLENLKVSKSYFDNFNAYLKGKDFNKIFMHQIEDKPFEEESINYFKRVEKEIEFIKSPMFLFSREELREFQGDSSKYRMVSFYKKSRLNLNLLVDEDGNPEGGKWSFDEENRKKFPRDIELPTQPTYKKSKHHDDIIQIIEKYFSDHPGLLDNFWFPVTREQAKNHFDNFLKVKFNNFGLYEDAMLNEENFLFHSCISSSLNLGLITPWEILKSINKHVSKFEIPLNSLEGFLRQLIGWREFIRGIYQDQSEFQLQSNYWNHTNKLSKSWYDGTTGIVPLDDCIKSVLKDGYNHHIPRLMIISNLMNMCEIHPDEIYKWFMEMYIDSSDWVMVPNVYGMATFADGGLMSTKPYTCGSNYMMKMSNYKKGEWNDTVDGLYWRFTEKHRNFFEKNARMSFLTRTLDRLDPVRKKNIFANAEKFIKENTK